MTTIVNGDDDSFIILGTSPGSSLDMKYSGTENGDVGLNKDELDEAMKDLPVEANMAFKAHFKLGASDPSATSMMVASTIITDDKSTEELQKRFGELLDENVILKETLKQNNESMKEQFLLIASCQEDMMKTHMLHKEKFDETKGLVKRLREENRKLKHDISRLSDADSQSQSQTSSENGEKESGTSGPSSALEFVTSPDDDTFNKLTSQLDLVEKQRRQVIVENEKLTWQKESLEHIVDVTSKERDEYKEKLKNVELQLSTQETEHAAEVRKLKVIIRDLELEVEGLTATSITPATLAKRDMVIEQLEARVKGLVTDLKLAQLKIFELESLKMEVMKQKSGESEMVRTYRGQIQDLRSRLMDASRINMFKHVQAYVTEELDPSSSEVNKFHNNVKMYDRTLTHLTEVLNAMTYGAIDRLIEALGLISSLQEVKLDKSSVEQFKTCLRDVKLRLETYHNTTLKNVSSIRSSIQIFQGIFEDFTELVKTSASKPKVERTADNVGALTAALVARGQELQQMQTEIERLQEKIENTEVMKAQLELYKSDFEAERDSRAKMASEKDTVLTDLRTLEKRNLVLVKQLNEVRSINGTVYSIAVDRVTNNPPATSPATSSATARPHPSPARTSTGNVVRKKKKLSEESNTSEGATKEGTPPPLRFDCPVCDKPFKSLILLQQHVYTCPKCMRFSCEQYKVMEDHFDFCLDDF